MTDLVSKLGTQDIDLPRRNTSMMSRITFALLILLAGANLGSAADWSHWRGPWQTGVSPEKDLPKSWDPSTGENLVWVAPYGCRSTPLVLNDRVYFINYTAKKIKQADGGEKDEAATIQERVVCLDANTGKLVWDFKFNIFHTDIVTVRLGWTNIAADPATGNIYAHGTGGMLYCLSKDGKVLWSKSLTEEYGRISGYGGRLTSPIVAEDMVIIGMLNSSWGDHAKGGCRFVAMNKDSGQVIWWSEPGGQPKDTFYSVPAVATIEGQKLLITGGADGGVYALKLRTGEKVWGFTLGTSAINCSPVVDGNLIYIGHGEESPGTNVQGRVVCLDGSKVTKGEPALVWKKDGIKARYTSPIIHEGRLYITDDIGKLFCLDGKTGEQQWKFSYGRNSRASPVWADGRIYMAEVNSKFHILEPGEKKCKFLHSQFFTSPSGDDIELNGTAAIANGRVYFSTNEEFYCIGKKGAKGASVAISEPVPASKSGHTYAQIVPADVTIHPGETVNFAIRLYNDLGQLLPVEESPVGDWSLPAPPLPAGAKTPPPALEGNVKAGKLTVSMKPSQQGYVEAKVGNLVAKARVRVAPRIPYAQDFEKIPDGAAPGGWVNTQGKFVVATVDGNKVLRKVNDKASPLIARGNAYISLPTAGDYTIESDVLGTKKGEGDSANMPDIGVVANRYTLVLSGNVQKLRILAWGALPRLDQTADFSWQPGVWYRLKLTVQGQKVMGKAWKKGDAEPTDWTVQVTDPLLQSEGSAGLYGYVQGIVEGQPGTEIYYDNVKISPNKK